MKRIEFIEGRLNAYLLQLKMENRFINLEPSTPWQTLAASGFIICFFYQR